MSGAKIHTRRARQRPRGASFGAITTFCGGDDRSLGGPPPPPGGDGGPFSRGPRLLRQAQNPSPVATRVAGAPDPEHLTPQALAALFAFAVPLCCALCVGAKQHLARLIHAARKLCGSLP